MHVVKVTGLTPRERCYPILRYSKQGFGSVFIWYGSESIILGWKTNPDPDLIRIQGIMTKKRFTAGKKLNFLLIKNSFFYFFKNICLRWAGPQPHIPFPSRPHFVCKFSRHGDNLSVLRPGSSSIIVLVFPDFADAYSRTTASYRLTQLLGKIPEISQFLGSSKQPFLEWSSLNAGTTMHTYSVSLTPNLCLFKLP